TLFRSICSASVCQRTYSRVFFEEFPKMGGVGEVQVVSYLGDALVLILETNLCFQEKHFIDPGTGCLAADFFDDGGKILGSQVHFVRIERNFSLLNKVISQKGFKLGEYMDVFVCVRRLVGTTALVDIIDFVEYDINQASDDFGSVGSDIKGFFMDQFKIGGEFLILTGIERYHLLTGFLKKLELIQVVDVHLTFEKYLFTEKEYFGLIGRIKFGKFTNRRGSNGKDGRCFGLLHKEVGLKLNFSFTQQTDGIG